MRFPSWFACAAAVAALSSPVRAADAPEPIALDASADVAVLAQRALAVTEPAAARGVAKVAIPLLSVQFVTADAVSGETSGFGAAGRAHASAAYSLVDVGEADFTALAARLYDRVVQGLRDAGVEVVPADAVVAAPTWRKLAAGGSPSPLRSDAAVTVAPHGLTIYGVNRATAKKGGGLMAAISGFGDVAAAIGAGMEAPQLQHELGGAALLEGDVKVHFVQLTNHNRGFLGRMSDQAKVSGAAYPSIVEARFTLRQGVQASTIALTQPLALAPTAFVAVREESKTAGDIAGAVVSGLIRIAAGNQDTSASTRYQAVADPVRYRAVVGHGLETLGSMVTARIAAVK